MRADLHCLMRTIGQTVSVLFPKDEARLRRGPALGASSKEGYSIVRCLPVTGRTHQLRVHLQHLGHPIQNDPIYANQRVWGFELGSNDADGTQNTDEDIITRLSKMGKDDVASAVAYYDEVVDTYHQKKAEKLSGDLCDICDTPLYTDPGQHELALWLHSLRYDTPAVRLRSDDRILTCMCRQCLPVSPIFR